MEKQIILAILFVLILAISRFRFRGLIYLSFLLIIISAIVTGLLENPTETVINSYGKAIMFLLVCVVFFRFYTSSALYRLILYLLFYFGIIMSMFSNNCITPPDFIVDFLIVNDIGIQLETLFTITVFSFFIIVAFILYILIPFIFSIIPIIGKSWLAVFVSSTLFKLFIPLLENDSRYLPKRFFIETFLFIGAVIVAPVLAEAIAEMICKPEDPISGFRVLDNYMQSIFTSIEELRKLR